MQRNPNPTNLACCWSYVPSRLCGCLLLDISEAEWVTCLTYGTDGLSFMWSLAIRLTDLRQNSSISQRRQLVLPLKQLPISTHSMVLWIHIFFFESINSFVEFHDYFRPSGSPPRYFFPSGIETCQLLLWTACVLTLSPQHSMNHLWRHLFPIHRNQLDSVVRAFV